MSRGGQVVVFALTLLFSLPERAHSQSLEKERSDLHGRVVDEDGKPLPDAFIRFGDCGSTYSREDGSFSFQALQRWGYTCRLYEVSKAGYLFKDQPPLVVLKPGPLPEIELRLRRGTIVTGRIRELKPRELTRLRIGASFGDLADCGMGTRSVRGQVEPDGRYRIEGVDSFQRAEIRAWTEDPSRYVRLPLLLQPGQKKAVLNFEFPPVHAVHGRVLGVDGEPLQGARVELQLQGTSLTTATETHTGGSFSLAAQPGEYSLSISRSGYVSQEVSNVKVENAPVQGLEVRLPRGGDLRGRFSGVELKPGEVLAVSVEGLRSAHTIADPEGRYRLSDLKPGPWEVTAGVWATEGVGDARTVHRQVVIQPGTETVLDVDLQTGSLTLSGSVQDRGRSGRILFELQSTADPTVVNSTYRYEGFFTFTRLQPGPHRLRLKDEDGKVLYEQDVELPFQGELVIDLAGNPRG